MTLRFEDFITPRSLAPLLQDRRDDYLDKAVTYLRANFAPSLRLLDDSQVRRVAKLSYDTAAVRGIKSERDHLKYLVPVMFWGSYFEHDPQYATCLRAAGWVDDAGAAVIGASFAALFEQIDTWAAQTDQDTQSPRRLVRGFARIQSLPMDVQNLAGIVGIMTDIWPARTGRMTPAQAKAFAKIAAARATDLGLTGADVATHICLSQYFGIGFGHDPRFVWHQSNPELYRRDPEAYRLALGEGVLRFWDGLEDRLK